MDKKKSTCIPASNCISLFFHCRKCLAEKPSGISPKEFGSIESGWTKMGFQVWCKRHEVNIIHVDFGGQKVRANQGIAEDN